MNDTINYCRLGVTPAQLIIVGVVYLKRCMRVGMPIDYICNHFLDMYTKVSAKNNDSDSINYCRHAKSTLSYLHGR